MSLETEHYYAKSLDLDPPSHLVLEIDKKSQVDSDPERAREEEGIWTSNPKLSRSVTTTLNKAIETITGIYRGSKSEMDILATSAENDQNISGKDFASLLVRKKLKDLGSTNA